jgi:antitoxin component of RelBE/YafQ-DinJ toxin-antitoxin module
MVLKTFNLDEKTYKKFSDFCKENGISMSKQVNLFIEAQIEENPEIREEYLKKLEKIRKGKFIKIGSIEDLKKRYS